MNDANEPPLPLEGFPASSQPVAQWFRDRFGREPGDAELGEILVRMAARGATPPVEQTGAGSDTFTTGDSAPPADRR